MTLSYFNLSEDNICILYMHTYAQWAYQQKILTWELTFIYWETCKQFLDHIWLLKNRDKYVNYFVSLFCSSNISLRGHNPLVFIGLNLSCKLVRGHGDIEQREAIKAKYRRLCQHFFCMILYEDPAEPARHEHMAQM